MRFPKAIAILAAALTCSAGLPAATTPKKTTAPRKSSASFVRKRSGTKSTGTKPSASTRKPGTRSPRSSAKSKYVARTAPRNQKAPVRAARATWHPGQTAPTSDRYKEIQEALAKKGYLHGEASGVWDPSSADALRRFQQDQSLQASGKLDSLSIIALGLGPKY